MNTDESHWGPFGRPLFDDPEAQALSRVGVVDVGSNSVRMVIFDGAGRSPAYFFNEKVMCGLGKGLQETGRLNPEGRARALRALERFKAVADGLDMAPLTAVATAAVRDAEDGPEFAAKVKKATGIKMFVVSGKDEARLSAQGVLLGWPNSEGLVCDIGGSSMEFAVLKGNKVGKRLTSDLGPLKLQDISKPEKHIRKTLDAMHRDLGKPKGQRIFLVGGSWRAIAKVDMERRGYPLHVLHEYRMTADDVVATAKLIAEADQIDLRSRCGISASRMALVPLAAQVLRQVVEMFEPEDICISAYGIREGMLYEQMPAALRARDPLIEASRWSEAKDARNPGFGRTLFQFVRPLFPDLALDEERIYRAACYLHDVNWRAHPDFRPQICFETATRSNLAGMTHEERVFVGLALMYRYSSKRPAEQFAPLLKLLPEADQAKAEVLGKAMRLGAMLWLKPGVQPAGLVWRSQDKVLDLRLTPAAQALFGEVTEARFKKLAGTLGAKAVVTTL